MTGPVERWQVRFRDGQTAYVLSKSLTILDGGGEGAPELGRGVNRWVILDGRPHEMLAGGAY